MLVMTLTPLISSSVQFNTIGKLLTGERFVTFMGFKENLTTVLPFHRRRDYETKSPKTQKPETRKMSKLICLHTYLSF